jgi:hypothetical protein
MVPERMMKKISEYQYFNSFAVILICTQCTAYHQIEIMLIGYNVTLQNEIEI